MKKITDRTKPLTNKEFKALNRYDNGDLKDEQNEFSCLSEIFCFLTEQQVDKLSDDDWSRYQNFEEEMRCELNNL